MARPRGSAQRQPDVAHGSTAAPTGRGYELSRPERSGGDGDCTAGWKHCQANLVRALDEWRQDAGSNDNQRRQPAQPNIHNQPNESSQKPVERPPTKQDKHQKGGKYPENENARGHRLGNVAKSGDSTVHCITSRARASTSGCSEARAGARGEAKAAGGPAAGLHGGMSGRKWNPEQA